MHDAEAPGGAPRPALRSYSVIVSEDVRQALLRAKEDELKRLAVARQGTSVRGSPPRCDGSACCRRRVAGGAGAAAVSSRLCGTTGQSQLPRCLLENNPCSRRFAGRQIANTSAMQRYTSRAAALVAARSVLGSGGLAGTPASPALLSAVMFPAGSWRLASDVEKGGSEQPNPNRPSAGAWVGGAAGRNIPEAGRKKAVRAPHVSSTCGATIEEQQALWFALACIVMRPRVRSDELKKTLGDAEKLPLLITTAMRSMNGEFDNKDLVKRQIEVAERDISGVDMGDVVALRTFFGRE
jgi:hypothetical protein